MKCILLPASLLNLTLLNLIKLCTWSDHQSCQVFPQDCTFLMTLYLWILALQTGLMVACYHGHVDVVIALSLCPHLDVNWQDNEGNTALITAAQAGGFHFAFYSHSHGAENSDENSGKSDHLFILIFFSDNRPLLIIQYNCLMHTAESQTHGSCSWFTPTNNSNVENMFFHRSI